MPELTLSPEAEQDLIDIWSYIAENSPTNADKYIDKLYSKSSLLADNPDIGTPYTKLIDELYRFPVDHYLLFYRKYSDGIEIIRILHSSRDIEAIL